MPTYTVKYRQLPSSIQQILVTDYSFNTHRRCCWLIGQTIAVNIPIGCEQGITAKAGDITRVG